MALTKRLERWRIDTICRISIIFTQLCSFGVSLESATPFAIKNRDSLPLAVDLDGTLTRTDTLIEMLILLLRNHPRKVMDFFVTMLRQGKAPAKAWLAKIVQIDAATLPYNRELLDYLKQQKESGRYLVLATASHMAVGRAVADHLKLFDQVIASEDVNLSGTKKAERLTTLFGPKGFVYAGNAAIDLEVWKQSQSAIVVNSSRRIVAAAEKLGAIETSFPATRASIRTWRRVLRVHQWAKNLLLFAPLMLAHDLNPANWLQCALGFLSYSLCASSAYVLNDLLDLPDDRRHSDKKRRPFAAGTVSVFLGLALIPMLFFGGLGLGYAVSGEFAMVVIGYYLATLLYSLSLKRKPLIDIFCLASLYTWRIFAGSIATSTRLSEWLLAFSIFAFLSLAMVKRCSELKAAIRAGHKLISGRGYGVDDIALVETFGAATSCTAVLILAIYIASPDVARLYHHPRFLLLICPMALFWFVRVWHLTHRMRMHSDPIVFALNDRVTYLIIVAGLVLGFLAA